MPNLSNVKLPNASTNQMVHWSGAILIESSLQTAFPGRQLVIRKLLRQGTQKIKPPLWQPCRTFHRTNRWFPSLLIYCIGSLALDGPCQTQNVLVSVFQKELSRNLYSLVYHTVYILYTTVKEQRKIFYMLHGKCKLSFVLPVFKYYFGLKLNIFILRV